MNCQKAKPLIPLFVEADLDAAEMQQVTEHLVTCDACREIVAEFQASQLSLRAAKLPEFDEVMFVEMRIAVQRAITPTATRPTFAEWLQPLWTWKIAFAASIALLLLSGIVMYRRGAETNHVQVSAETKAVNPTLPTLNLKQLSQNTPIVLPVSQPRTGRKNKAQGEVSASERNPGNTTHKPFSPERAMDGNNSFVAASNAPSEATDLSARVPFLSLPEKATELSNLNLEKSTPEPEMLRVEIQTADPNIKIIWLLPKGPARTNTVTETK